MTELGEVLEAIHASPRRFARARVHGHGADGAWRLWWAGDRRYRLESDGPSGRTLTVRDGDVWWLRGADGTARTNAHGPSAGLGAPPQFALLHTSDLLAVSLLDLVGVDTVAGRRAARLRATPRPGTTSARWWGFGRSGEAISVAVDLERGVALASPWLSMDAIAFDEDFGPEMFARPWPDDQPERPAMDQPQEVTLERARELAPFPVTVPNRLPEGARLLRCMVDDDQPPAWVALSWAIDPGYASVLHLRQGPGVDREAERSQVERAGAADGGVRVVESPLSGPLRQLLVDVGGRWYEFDSDLPTETLLMVARSLEARP